METITVAPKSKSKPARKGKRVNKRRPKNPTRERAIVLRGFGAYKESSMSNKDFVGEGAGRFAKWVWDKIFGSGKYTMPSFPVKSNSFMKQITVSGPPAIHRNPDGGITIPHKEYLGDLVTSEDAGGFKIQKFRVNPGDPVTFPWLANLARNYQQYRLKGVVFCFKSSASNALPASDYGIGIVAMMSEYNVESPPPGGKIEMLNSFFASECRQTESIIHPIECDRTQTTLPVMFIRHGNTSDKDSRFTDWCNFYIATQGGPTASVNIGEIWVSYDIELMKPITSSSGGDYDHYWISGAGPANATPFLGMERIHGNLGTSIVSTNDGLSFPNSNPGDAFLLIWRMDKSAPEAVTGPFSIGLHYCTGQGFWNKTAANVDSPLTGTTCQSFTFHLYFTIDDVAINEDDPPVVQFTMAAGVGLINYVDALVIKLNPTVNDESRTRKTPFKMPALAKQMVPNSVQSEGFKVVKW